MAGGPKTAWPREGDGSMTTELGRLEDLPLVDYVESNSHVKGDRQQVKAE